MGGLLILWLFFCLEVEDSSAGYLCSSIELRTRKYVVHVVIIPETPLVLPPSLTRFVPFPASSIRFSLFGILGALFGIIDIPFPLGITDFGSKPRCQALTTEKSLRSAVVDAKIEIDVCACFLK